MAKYTNKPVVIEAVQWLASMESWDQIKDMGCPTKPGPMDTDTFFIPTIEGAMIVDKGDWVIKGINGEFHICKPDIFEATYELA